MQACTNFLKPYKIFMQACTNPLKPYKSFLQPARTRWSPTKASCSLHGPAEALQKLLAACTDSLKPYKSFLQPARTRWSPTKASCSLHGLFEGNRKPKEQAAIIFHTNRTSLLTKRTQSKAEIYYLCKWTLNENSMKRIWCYLFDGYGVTYLCFAWLFRQKPS